MIKTGIYRTALLLLAFFLFTMAVINVDVQPIGPENSRVGFADINGAVQSAFPYSEFFYQLTTYLGYLALLAVLGYGVLGILQLIKHRSLKRVDKQLMALGAFFVLMLLCYAVFEKLPVNYRPVILEEGLEASYPSSHTMLALCVFGAMMVPYPQLIPAEKLTLVRIAAGTLMVISVVGRLLSGVHWLTDIVGAMLLSATLISFYCMLLQLGRLRKKHPADPGDKEGNWDDSTDDGFGDLFRDE